MKKETLVKTLLAVVASAALSAVLLLTLPAMSLLITLIIINAFYLVTRIDIQNNINSIFQITCVVSGILALLAGVTLNLAFIFKANRRYKIISVVLYIAVMVIFAVFLSPYIQYQLTHQSLKV